MRPEAPEPNVLVNDLSWRPIVDSYLGSRRLAADIPTEDGNAVYSIDQKVPDTLMVSIPLEAMGRKWEPTSTYDPLARYGQQLQVHLQVKSQGHEWKVPVGRYQIENWDIEGGLIKVDGKGLLQKAVTDELYIPKSPPRAATFRTEILRVMPPGVDVQFDHRLRDRSVPRDIKWGVSRIDTLYELAEAWPARLRVNEFGVVRFLPVLDNTRSGNISLHDKQNGTVVGLPKSDSREGFYNRVIIEGQANDAGIPSFQAVEEILEGPMSIFTYSAVTYRESPQLVKTKPQAQAMAKNLLDQFRRSSFVLPVEMVSDPRLQVDDVVNVEARGQKYTGWINGWDLPFRYNNSMRIDVGVSI